MKPLSLLPGCFSRLGEPFQHESNHGQTHHTFATAHLILIILTHTTVAPDPREGPFYYPSPFEHVKATRADLLPIDFLPFLDPDGSDTTPRMFDHLQPSVSLTHCAKPPLVYPLSVQRSSRRGKRSTSGASRSLPP